MRVSDTGCGISKEIREHMFEPFFTTKKEGFGTGLGLATVYSIVKQHEGMIQVVSELGKGSCFSIYLPVAQSPNEPIAVEKSDGALVGGTETLLLAEDDDMVRELTACILRKAGYTVLEARDGEEALELFQANASSVAGVLLDVIMPRMGGFEACERILALSPQLPVIFASAFSEQALHTQFALGSGINLLQKPFDRSTLLGAVRRMIDARELDGRNARL